MNLRKLGRKIDRARRQAQNIGTLGASDAIGGALARAGVPMDARTLIGRTVGGRNAKALGYGGRGPKKPDITDPIDGLPEGRLGDACKAVNPRDGSTSRPYVIIGRIQLAASAQAINTDLGDFLDAANVDDITADNVVPFGFKARQAQLFVGLNELIASPVANPAMLAAFSIRFLVNGREEARWPILKFNPVFSNNGLVTSGGGAMLGQYEYTPVPFVIDFDPDSTYSLPVYNSKAVTPAAVVDMTLVIDGSL